MIIELLTEHHLEFLSLKGAAEAHPSLHLSKCQIVGNLMHWLKFNLIYILGGRVISSASLIAKSFLHVIDNIGVLVSSFNLSYIT